MFYCKLRTLVGLFGLCLFSMIATADDHHSKEEAALRKKMMKKLNSSEITIGDIKFKNGHQVSKKFIIKNKDGEELTLSDEMTKKIQDAIKLKMNGGDFSNGKKTILSHTVVLMKSSHKLNKEKFNLLDKDENENLDQGEFLAHVKNYFDSIDKDANNELNTDEYASVAAISSCRLKGVSPGDFKETTVTRHVSLSGNKELYISAKTSKLDEAEFDLLDQDKNGLITYEEFSSGAIKKFEILDQDKNQYISLEEIKK